MSVLDVISTLLREGRRLLALHALLDRLFQSTPLREGRRPPRRRNRRRRLFQSTPLREGRPFRAQRARAVGRFNPRPSVRGDVNFLTEISNYTWFQSTPLREGRRVENHGQFAQYYVSIHAPP